MTSTNLDVSLVLQSRATGKFYPSRALYDGSTKTLTIVSGLVTESETTANRPFPLEALQMCIAALSYTDDRFKAETAEQGPEVKYQSPGPGHDRHLDGTLTASPTQMTQSNTSTAGGKTYSLTTNHGGHPILTMWTRLPDGRATKIRIMGRSEYMHPLTQEVKNAGTDKGKSSRVTAPLLSHLAAEMKLRAPDHYVAFGTAVVSDGYMLG